jgi:hypothetical protein
MKKSNDQSLGDAIREMLDAYKLNDKLDEVEAIKHWPDVVGEMITQYTKDIYIRNGKLFVRIENAALKNELLYARTTIIESLNKEAGKNVVKEIVFI